MSIQEISAGDFSLAAVPKSHLDGTWIGGILVGGEDFSDGNVKEIDPTKSHTLNIGWTINNANPGWAPAWDGGASLYNLTDDKEVDWERSDADGKQGVGWESLVTGAISKPTTFRVNIFANQNFRVGTKPSIALQKQRA